MSALAVEYVHVVLPPWRDAGRRKLHEEGRCRMCQRSSSVRRLTRHHLVPQSWFNRRIFVVASVRVDRYLLRDCDANIVPLCQPCHVEVENEESGRAMLRRLLGGQEAGFAVQFRGQDWFDRIYPATSGLTLPVSG